MAELLSNVIEGSGGGGGCFRAGTLIQLEHGKTTPIELLKEGDPVLAFDEQGKVHVSRVTKVHYHPEPQPLLRVRFWRGEVCLTPNHWVLNQYVAFAEVGSLSEHDALVDGLGHLRPIIGAESVGSEPVWNLTVEPHHTFIADGIRVHNGGHRVSYPEIEGAGGGGGGKGGGGSARAAVEADDSLQSKASVGILDLIGEGEIGGLVGDGNLRARSIFVNDTPLMNADGSYNFSDVAWEERTGTQNQTAIYGSSAFDAVSSPMSVGVQLKYASPYSVTVQNPSANEAMVILTVPQLMSQDKTTGDISGASVSYHIDVAIDGSGFDTVGSYTISGKTRSRYQRSHLVKLPPGNIRIIRVVRDTADSSSAALTNDLFFDSYVERVTTILNYPNTALVAVTINAAQFSSIPSRSYLVDGLYIRVPTNYDPVTRTYSGIWNGTFKVAISSNPAWVLYDLLTNTRYGLGDYLTPDQVDKTTLYKIGRYCDEQVPNGTGGTEPRFSCNIVINSLSDAYKVIANISSIFRGMGFWNGSGVGFTHDAPRDPSMIYNQTNVINGEFSYVGSSRKNRHSVALITWNDPSEGYKQKIEYVEDAEMIERVGVRKTDMIAFGCTSRSQAHRLGRWLLHTEKYEAQMISFKVGIDSAMVMPGEVVLIHDDHRAGKRLGGRAKATTLTSLTPDAPITLDASGALVLIRLPNGTFEERPIQQGVGTHTALTWSTELSELPVSGAIYIVSEPNLVPLTARVIGITQGDVAGTYVMNVLEHNPSKYGAIEYGYALDTTPISKIDINYVTAPTEMKIIETKRPIAGTNIMVPALLVTWSGDCQSYEVAYRCTDPANRTDWKSISTTYPSADISGVAAGNYEISLLGVNAFGVKSPSVVMQYNVILTDTTPDDVQNLMLREEWLGKSVSFVWDAVPYVSKYRVQILSNGEVRRDVFTTETEFSYSAETAAIDGGPWRNIVIRVKAVKPSGIQSASFTSLSVSNPAPSLLGLRVDEAYLALIVNYLRPNDLDFEGVEVWMSDVSGFTPSDLTRVYDGANTRITIQTDAFGLPLSVKPYYIRIRAYDTFGKTDGIMSAEYEGTPVSASLGLGPGEIVGTQISSGAIKAENLKTKRHMID